ncbi:hypothetical protein B0T20DRAFT_495792 [Sordaria brevicollis]|uniref:Uncharacterized protein n=1 Tax=Sordaria brevicollis TaxID=83679 RepID=A0AAE0PH16_SORBR|nr:hypothetical protein B0T20DRAFT_495792 [Sordaria brevicollis]
MPPIPDGPFFSLDIFRLNHLMRTTQYESPTITPAIQARCWIVIDIIYTHFLEQDLDPYTGKKRVRPLADIVYIAVTEHLAQASRRGHGHSTGENGPGDTCSGIDWNPTVTAIPEINFAEEVYRWCWRNYEEGEEYLRYCVEGLDQRWRGVSGLIFPTDSNNTPHLAWCPRCYLPRATNSPPTMVSNDETTGATNDLLFSDDFGSFFPSVRSNYRAAVASTSPVATLSPHTLPNASRPVYNFGEKWKRHFGEERQGTGSLLTVTGPAIDGEDFPHGDGDVDMTEASRAPTSRRILVTAQLSVPGKKNFSDFKLELANVQSLRSEHRHETPSAPAPSVQSGRSPEQAGRPADQQTSRPVTTSVTRAIWHFVSVRWTRPDVRMNEGRGVQSQGPVIDDDERLVRLGYMTSRHGTGLVDKSMTCAGPAVRG